MRRRNIGPPECPDIPDEPIACLQCDKEPPCDEAGDPDYDSWFSWSFCSEACYEKFNHQIEAQNKAESEMIDQFIKDEAEAREYFANRETEGPEEFGPDFT